MARNLPRSKHRGELRRKKGETSAQSPTNGKMGTLSSDPALGRRTLLCAEDKRGSHNTFVEPLPLIEPVCVSVAVRVCVPVFLKVTVKVCTPASAEVNV